jgi:hypothetical protein
MIAITVSTKYDDILNIVIPQNYKFFEKWYIITSRDDEKTINVINKYGYSNIVIIYYDFYYNNKKFNKGGAIRYFQKILGSFDYKGLVLLLDSDIYLPDNVLAIIEKTEIEKGVLYGPMSRSDYYSYENFKNNIVDLEYKYPWQFHGYFQLYQFDKTFLYKEYKNAAVCDIVFHEYFSTGKILTQIHVAHLGKEQVNWDSRQNKDDFKI